MSKTVNATLVLLRDNSGRICLAPKKEHIHKGNEELKGSNMKWNGYGGKQKNGRTVLQTAIDELWEESTVIGKEEDLELVAKINGFWPKNRTINPDMIFYIFFLAVFEGEPKEGIEMGVPQFFYPDDVPYHNMMSGDKLFLPKIIRGRKLVGSVYHRPHEDGGPYFEEEPGISPTL